MVDIARLVGCGALAVLLSGTPGLGQEGAEEANWDADGNGLLSVDEFREGLFARLDLADWDIDGDGFLSMGEFYGGAYARYDVDATDAIEEAEQGALERDFGEDGLWVYEGGELVEAPGEQVQGGSDEEEVVDLLPWDIDGDGVIVREEFEGGLNDWGTYTQFDRDLDGLISQDELAEGLFGLYDDDLDGFIEGPELTDIGDDMGSRGFWDD